MKTLTGAYLVATRILKALRLTLTTQGREELTAYLTNGCGQCGEREGLHRSPDSAIADPAFVRDHVYVIPNGELNWSKRPDEITAELIEDLRECGDLELISDEDNARLIGALTSAPILVTKPRHDDSDEGNGELVEFDEVFAFMNYQIEDWLETLMRQGHVDFDLGSDEQDVYSCGECGKSLGYDQAAIDAHDCDPLERRAYQIVLKQRAESEAL